MDTLGYFDHAGRPRIEIKIKFRLRTKKFIALLDSGADFCLLPKTIGLNLGLKIPNMPSGISHGVGGEVPVKHVRLKY